MAGLVLASGCKTSEGDGSAILDGTELGPVPAQAHDDLSAVPPSLWSPAQRRSSAGYYFLVAEAVAHRERDNKRALPIYEAAYSLDPNPFLGGKVITAKASAGERGEALADARKMILLYPKDANIRYLYGRLNLEIGQLGLAEKELERTVSLDPRFEQAYTDLLEIQRVTRNSSKAVAIAKDMTKNLPHSVFGWMTLARLHMAAGQYKEALGPARRAYEMQSGNLALTQVYAVILQLNGKTKKAVRLYEKLFRMNPADEALTGRMIDLYRELGNLEDAISLIDDLISESGKDKPGFLMQKAILLWELKRFQEASQLLSELARDFPEFDRLHYMNGLGFERLEEYEKALEAYRRVSPGSRFRYESDYRTIVVLKNQKKTAKAMAMARRLIEEDGVEWDAFILTAGVLADDKKYQEAVDVLATGYRKFPDKPRLLFLQGVYQEKSGDVDGCIATMRLVIAKDPTNSSAYNYLGYLYAERGENLKEAEQLIRKALELKPNDGFYMDSLGWVYVQMGDLEKALPHLEKASELEPKEGVILEHLGDVRQKQGKIDQAAELYDRALKMQLEDRDRIRVEKKIKEIRGKL